MVKFSPDAKYKIAWQTDKRMVLQQAGYQSKRINHGKTRGWVVRERGLEEVNANRNIAGRG